LGAKVILLVSMWVSVGGVGSTDHVATRISVKAQEGVQMTTTINSETKNHLKPASATGTATRHTSGQGRKGPRESVILGKQKRTGGLERRCSGAVDGIALLQPEKTALKYKAVTSHVQRIVRFDSSTRSTSITARCTCGPIIRRRFLASFH